MLYLLTLTSMAFAHIALEDPKPRYRSDGSSNNKACPCGVGESNRLCNVASDRSDPDRSTNRIATYPAGSRITLRFRETIGHAGRYRIAFDDDGADLEDFNAHILRDLVDPPGSTGNIGEGDVWELKVTLPDQPCDNCTLQLIQMMDGNMDDPVPDPVGRSSYYQCVDLVLTEPVGTDTGTLGSDDTEQGAAVDQAMGSSCGCGSLPGPGAGWWLLGLALPLLRRSNPGPAA